MGAEDFCCAFGLGVGEGGGRRAGFRPCWDVCLSWTRTGIGTMGFPKKTAPAVTEYCCDDVQVL